MTSTDLSARLGIEAERLGFAQLGVASTDAAPLTAARLHEWLADGRHGDMLWMAETETRRGSPQALWPAVRSVILLGTSYAPSLDPLRHAVQGDIGAVSVYALGRDYHDIIKARLKALAGWLVRAATTDCASADSAAIQVDVKVFVDTAPVMEKPLAQAAGLGWQGKHTNLVSRVHGSWLFLAAIYTTLDLASDIPSCDSCGSCSRCQTACPTAAFPAPYQLDARRCISYLTIEHKGTIPVEFRRAMGNRIYGCDDCLAVCPWNKFAQSSRDIAFEPRAELTAPRLADLLQLDDTAFRAVFAGSPVKRVGRDRFVRNVLIAAGNSGTRALLANVQPLLDDTSPVVRGAAVWAWRALGGAVDQARTAGELDADVASEWL